MDPEEITIIKNVITHQGALLGWQQEQLSQISETLRAFTNSLLPRPNPNPGGANAQVSSPSTTGVAIVLPGNLHREPKIPAPERYDGYPGGCKGFLTQCSLVFELQSSSFHTDRAMIAYIISLLSGWALAWAMAVWEQQTPSCSSILAFTAELRRVFDHPVGGREAASRLFRLRQGARPVADFTIEFCTLAAESGWNTEALVTTFHQGLSNPIKDELAARELGEDLKSLKTLAIRSDNRIQGRISFLAEMGFGGVLLYVDPCDSPSDQSMWHKAFGVTLNPGGDPSTPGYPSIVGIYREERPNLTSLLVQPISASLAKRLLNIQSVGLGSPCTPLAMPAASERRKIQLTIGTHSTYKTVNNVCGYLRGKANPDRYVLVGSRHDSWHKGTAADWRGGSAMMTQIITSVTKQARRGWEPDRTTVFCSWGGSALGNIGSFEWGEENRVVLQSRVVAYVSLHSPVRGTETLRSTASPSLLQLTSDIQKRQLLSCIRGGNCPGPNVSSLQIPGDVSFFANHLAVPTMEFAFEQTKAEEKSSFLSEALFSAESPETLDPLFKFHETIAKMTAEVILRLVNDPVLPFYPLDIALDVQNKLKDDPLRTPRLLAAAASLRESSAFLQSETMRPANDPKERDPSHVRMLNDVLRDLEKSFMVPQPPPGVYRNLLYSLNGKVPQFSILKSPLEPLRHNAVNKSLSLIINAINSAEKLIRCGLDLFENSPDDTN
ncbi:hypothetical protein J4Q44_G00155250 [Coregonus suidteri]|uniref:Retrotransposon gag domain-containing protein n=1 Tax=Coregonus suidteri TaxID=861788 RepID=A0AAN8LZH6_9TELE